MISYSNNVIFMCIMLAFGGMMIARFVGMMIGLHLAVKKHKSVMGRV